MNYSRKDVIVGFAIILIIIAGAIYYKKIKSPKVLPSPTPVEISYQEDFDTRGGYFNKFKFDIPNNSNSIELKDVSGGDARGIATEKEVLVDANDPEIGYFYEAWLQDSNTQELVSLGKLQIVKGGWLLEFDKSKLSDAEKVIISLEKKFDNILEKRILEGSFN